MLKRLTSNLVKMASDPFVSASIMNEKVAKLPIFKQKLQNFVDIFNQLNRFVDFNIKKTSGEFKRQTTPTNFIEAYLNEKEKQDSSGKCYYFS
jgi:hypothetical protein